MKYRKRPVVVEAVRWDESCRFAEVPGWLREAVNKTRVQAGSIIRVDNSLHVVTLEGIMIARPGDWIIRGVAGELYPCKSQVFDATYEPAE